MNVAALSVVYVDDPVRVLGELRALRARLDRSVRISAGGAAASALAWDLAAMKVEVAESIPELIARMRRFTVVSLAAKGRLALVEKAGASVRPCKRESSGGSRRSTS